MRSSASKIGQGEDVLFTASLFDHEQFISCHVMCDEIGECAQS